MKIVSLDFIMMIFNGHEGRQIKRQRERQEFTNLTQTLPKYDCIKNLRKRIPRNASRAKFYKV